MAGSLLLFGGGDASSDFNDLSVLYPGGAPQGARGSGYWERILNMTGEYESRVQSACALLPAAGGSDSAVAPRSLLMHGGGGGNGESYGKRNTSQQLVLGDAAWAWAAQPVVSGHIGVARMAHSMTVVNSSCILLFGGNSDFGGHENDLIMLRPRGWRKQSGEASKGAAAGDGGDGFDGYEGSGEDGARLDDVDEEGGVGPGAGQQQQSTSAEESDEASRVRTVRASRRKSKKKKKARKAKAKEEL